MSPSALFVFTRFAAAATVVATLAVPLAAQAKKMRLNDTGMTLCNLNGVFSADCTGTGQDGEWGRDVDHPSSSNGVAGFAFQRVCNSGERAGTGNCSPNAVLGTGLNDWACTRDKVTGRVWEVKTADGGLRDKAKAYTNFGDGRVGDSSAFALAVNQTGLCGASNWRLPNVVELQSLVNYSVAALGLTIDGAWFPNTRNTWYWTSENYVGYGTTDHAWDVYFAYGHPSFTGKGTQLAVRLVHTGP